MAKQNELLSTSGSSSGARYRKATGIEMAGQATTSQPIGQVRTVVTTAKSGTLNLRYVPRNPKTSDKNTAH